MTKEEFDFWEHHLYDSSRACIEQVTEIAIHSESLFERVLNLTFLQMGVLSRRASRVVSFCMERNEKNYFKYSNMIIEQLEKIKDESIIFNLMRVFNFIALPKEEEYINKLYKISLDSLPADTKRIAIKVYAIENLYKIACHNSKYHNEVFNSIQQFISYEQPSVSFRAKRLYNLLKNKKIK